MKTKQVLKLLKDAREAATMERASFHLPGHNMFADADADTTAIREATRLYRETWIIYRLDEAIAEIERANR